MMEKLILPSQYLHEETTLQICYPENLKPERVLILLHGLVNPEGMFSLVEAFSLELEPEAFCRKYRLAIVTPFMWNRYYISTPDYDCEKFLVQELLPLLQQKFALPDLKNFLLGGVSMGGYGAALLAARTGLFSQVITISGAFISRDVLIGNPEVWEGRQPTIASTRGTFLQAFLPLDTLEESKERNVFAALSLLKEHPDPPRFVVTCGTEDWLYKRNQLFLRQLEEEKSPYRFLPIPGSHTGDCFREGLWKGMEMMEDESWSL